MSSVTNTEYKLVLYQVGLGTQHTFFDKTSESIVFKTALDAIKGNNPLKNGVIKAISDGIKDDIEEAPDKDFSNYFDIYHSQYSHQFIFSCDETIATILGYIH